MIFLLSAPASIPVVWLYDYDDDYQCYSSYSNYQSRWHSCHVRACTVARAIVLLPLPLTLGLPFTQSYGNVCDHLQMQEKVHARNCLYMVTGLVGHHNIKVMYVKLSLQVQQSEFSIQLHCKRKESANYTDPGLNVQAESASLELAFLCLARGRAIQVLTLSHLKMMSSLPPR